MTKMCRLETDDGKHWFVASGFLEVGPCVLVEVSQCEKLTDEEIGKRARGFFREATRMGILEEAEYLYRNKSFPLEDIKDFLDRAGIFEDEEPFVKQVCDSLRADIERFEKRKWLRDQAKARRYDLRLNYDSLFVSVGRRDGFKCAQCGSGADLTLDHKVALINGGDNALSNLQILCRTCNGKKGDSV